MSGLEVRADLHFWGADGWIAVEVGMNGLGDGLQGVERRSDAKTFC